MGDKLAPVESKNETTRDGMPQEGDGSPSSTRRGTLRDVAWEGTPGPPHLPGGVPTPPPAPLREEGTPHPRVP